MAPGATGATDAGGPAGESRGPDEVGEAVRARLDAYVELWASAGTKLSEGRYGPGDLAQDWARWAGMAAEDATTAVSALLRAMPTPGGPAEPDTDDAAPDDAQPDDPAAGGPAGGGG